MPDSFTIHLEPTTEQRLQRVHQLAIERFGKNISFDQLIRSALGAYESVCKIEIRKKSK